MLELLYKYVLIFLTGLLGIWKAVPVGLAFGTHPFMIWLLTSAGAVLAVLILNFFGSKIRAYIQKRREGKKNKKKEARAAKLFEKYGAAGLGILGCLLMGPNMTMVLGLVIVKSQKKLLFYTIAGILVWTAALTIIGIVSIDLFNKITGQA